MSNSSNFISIIAAVFSLSIVFPVQADETSLPVSKAKYTTEKIVLDGKLDEPAWKQADPIRVEKIIASGQVVPSVSTTVRTFWTNNDLYISFVAPYEKLKKFEPAIRDGKRVGLWESDVVEAFINSDPETDLNRYSEYEVAATGEKLDLLLRLPEKDFLWNSGFEAAVHLDETAKIWTTELRIPFSAFGKTKPGPGTRWRVNYYRHAIAEKSFLGWNPTLSTSSHVPERFGVLEFLK